MGIAIVIAINFFFPIQNPTTRNFVYIGLVVFSLVYFYWFKHYESNWDKKIILRMLESQRIALAKILSYGAVSHIRDSNFKNYIIYKLELEVIKPDLTSEKIVCYEKFNNNVTSIPQGHVYITYDEALPDHVFIIQNELLAHFHELAPMVKNYEAKVKDLKYLSVIQNQGLVIKTFHAHLKGK